MKYRVDLYFSGTITQFIEADDRQSAYEEAQEAGIKKALEIILEEGK